MAQFDVYRVGDNAFVLDCQSDSLSHLATRVVTPLMRAREVPAAASRLHPVFTFNGEAFLLAAHLLTAIATRDLGSPVASLDAERYRILTALDVLIRGV